MPINTSTNAFWKSDWACAQRHFIDWWNHRGMVFWCSAPADKPVADFPAPPAPRDLEERWYGARWRVDKWAYDLSRLYFGGDAFPMVETYSAAGDLVPYLDCPIGLWPETIWFKPCINDPPEDYGRIRLHPENHYFKKHSEMIALAVKESRGRWHVTLPDLIENMDILAALRDPQVLMMDLIERPEWVTDCLWQINDAFFQAFDHFYALTRDERGGNTFCFNVWGPGKSAKLQCDSSVLMSPAMFRKFVVPPLAAQAKKIDYAMYHLDGEDAIKHLDALLEIDAIKAIEWTPQRWSVGETGGHPMFYDLYRRILKAGKSVQAVFVEYDHVIPLLDAVGGTGMYIWSSAPTEEKARQMEEKVERYR